MNDLVEIPSTNYTCLTAIAFKFSLKSSRFIAIAKAVKFDSLILTFKRWQMALTILAKLPQLTPQRYT